MSYFFGYFLPYEKRLFPKKVGGYDPKSPPECTSTFIPSHISTTGAKVVANDTISDFALFLLTQLATFSLKKWQKSQMSKIHIAHIQHVKKLAFVKSHL